MSAREVQFICLWDFERARTEQAGGFRACWQGLESLDSLDSLYHMYHMYHMHHMHHMQDATTLFRDYINPYFKERHTEEAI